MESSQYDENIKEEKSMIIGIDLGTTNSLAAYFSKDGDRKSVV